MGRIKREDSFEYTDDFDIEEYTLDFKCFRMNGNSTTYTNTSDKYYINIEDKLRFTENQYNQFYVTRYEQLVDIIKSKVNNDDKYKNAPPLRGLSDMSDDDKGFVIGTIFRHSTARRNALGIFDDNDEEDQDVQLTVDQNPDDVFVQSDDYLEFEDSESQIIRISGLDLDLYTTGMVLGLFGTKENSKLNVFDVVYPGPPADRIPRPKLPRDKYIVLISGIHANTQNLNTWTKRFSLLKSALGTEPFDENIERIVICGNLSVDYCDCPKCVRISLDDVKHLGAVKDYSKDQAYVQMIENISKQFPYLSIDIMPGNEDPASIMWPQDPINKALLKKYIVNEDDELGTEEDDDYVDYTPAEQEVISDIGIKGRKRIKGEIVAVTNPYQFELRGIRFLGTSGDNVTYLQKMTNPNRSPVEVMEQMIELNHVCPTAPKAPDSYPFDRKKPDPMIIDKLPHVFFAGNQSSAYSYTKSYENNDTESVDVHFIGIPKTKDTMCAYVLNLRTMQLDAIDMKTGENQNDH